MFIVTKIRNNQSGLDRTDAQYAAARWCWMAKSSTVVGRQSRSNRSPSIISAKREFPRRWPGLLAIALRDWEIGSREIKSNTKSRDIRPVRRRLQTVAKRRTGWLATQCWSHRSPGQIPCKQGILQGISPLWPPEGTPHREKPCASRLRLEFPALGLQGKDSNEQEFLVR